MSSVDYSLADGVATLTMDDGKANALSPSMIAALNEGLDEADKDGSTTAVVLAGRSGRFSGGFDLSIMTSGPDAVTQLVQSGFELAERLLSSARPVVIACTGHAVAMGAMLLCAADYRVGAAGDFKIIANEVAIGLTMPYSALALMRYRLTPPAFDRAVGLSALFNPDSAVTAGWLDETVAPDAVVSTAQAAAASFASLDSNAHVASKLRARASVLRDVRRGIESGDRE